LILDEVFTFNLEGTMPSSHHPLIGLTSSLVKNQSGTPVCQVGEAYIKAVKKAGGLPLILPVGLDHADLEELLTKVDGVLFTGGGDIDLKYFNGASHPKVYGVSPERDALEFSLMSFTLAADKPFLAICRGIQVLNVAFGGNLYTHIQDQLENSLKHDWFPKFPRDKIAHSVRLTPGSKLFKIVGADEIQVNSLHHQGIKAVGKGLAAAAFAPDGIVEGLEVEGASFAVGVQWHPECLPEDEFSARLFKALINAC
jgi:putative glutamine amidotransferase